MHKISAKRRALERSVIELCARDPSVIISPSPTHPVPVASPLLGPLLSNESSGSTQPSTSPDPQPAITSTTGSGASGGGDDGGSTRAPIPSPTSGGGTAVSSGSTISNPVYPISTSGNPPSSPSADNVSSSGSTPSSSGPSVSGNFLSVGGHSTPVGPATTSGTFGTSTPGGLVAGLSSPLQYSLSAGSSPINTTSPSPTITISTAVSSGKHLSGGAIAGITVVCLSFLLTLILSVIRRRSTAHRAELRKKWFGHRDGSLSLANESPRGPIPASRRSSRSSFATNFDQGLMASVNPPSRLSLGIIPDLPPMAEVRERNSVFISTGGITARRGSVNSMLSNGSDPDAQYITVSGQHHPGPSSPMSVRLFSPSESFSFPKPPGPTSTPSDSFFFCGAQGAASSRSSATLVRLGTPPRAFMKDLPLPSVSIPSPYPQTSEFSVSPSSFIPSANPSVDPFADPEKLGFADIEVIHRPFKPSLDDEIAVRPGDRIRLLRIFDDGWAFIEKLADIEEESHERGLIPIDCLREVSQALPTFLTQKRVSVYGQAR